METRIWNPTGADEDVKVGEIDDGLKVEEADGEHQRTACAQALWIRTKSENGITSPSNEVR